MLIRFKVANFLSFKEETEFSMVAGKERIHPKHVIKGKKNEPNLLRTALLYGANAAGKSNFVKAINFAKLKITKNEESFPNQLSLPYHFKEKSSDTSRFTKQPSQFSFEFIVGDKLYEYSFSIFFGAILNERLLEINGDILFERNTSSDSKNFPIDTKGAKTTFADTNFLKTRKDKDFLEFVQRSTNFKKLFLTHCAENNVEWFREIFDWFQYSLQTIFPNTTDLLLKERLKTDKPFRDYFIYSLQKGGTDISSVKIETIAETYNNISTLFRSSREAQEIVKLKEDIDNLKNTIEIKGLGTESFITTFHGKAKFDKSQESEGTQRLFDLAFPFYDLATSETPKVYIIDELERNLHTNLSYMLLKSYLEHEGKGQLIATTHDTHLLDLDLLRRDEIWFAEKDEHGATQLYSLYEFNPRYDKKIEKEYLTGRFGAIPFLGNFEFKKRLAKNGKSKK